MFATVSQSLLSPGLFHSRKNCEKYSGVGAGLYKLSVGIKDVGEPAPCKPLPPASGGTGGKEGRHGALPLPRS